MSVSVQANHNPNLEQGPSPTKGSNLGIFGYILESVPLVFFLGLTGFLGWVGHTHHWKLPK